MKTCVLLHSKPWRIDLKQASIIHPGYFFILFQAAQIPSWSLTLRDMSQGHSFGIGPWLRSVPFPVFCLVCRENVVMCGQNGPQRTSWRHLEVAPSGKIGSLRFQRAGFWDFHFCSWIWILFEWSWGLLWDFTGSGSTWGHRFTVAWSYFCSAVAAPGILGKTTTCKWVISALVILSWRRSSIVINASCCIHLVYITRGWKREVVLLQYKSLFFATFIHYMLIQWCASSSSASTDLTWCFAPVVGC